MPATINKPITATPVKTTTINPSPGRLETPVVNKPREQIQAPGFPGGSTFIPPKDLRGGTPDDTIGGGAGVVDGLTGRYDGEEVTAFNERVENPTFLNPRKPVEGQVLAYAQSNGFTSAEVAQLDAVITAGGPAVATLMGALLERDPGALSETDANGATLLSNLERLAENPVHANAAGDTDTAEVLEGVLRDIVNPNRIHQGDAPTCTATSVQFELVADEPAEYARIMADLVTNGQSKLRNGGVFTLEAGETAARDGRSVSQTIFQNAAMELGNGADDDYDPFKRQSVNNKDGSTHQGLFPAEQTQLLRQVFGVNYESSKLRNAKDGGKFLEKIRDYDARGAENRPIILHIDQGPYNHAVTLDSVRDGKVFYRDPYGVLRSMPEEVFPHVVHWVNAPRDLNVI